MHMNEWINLHSTLNINIYNAISTLVLRKCMMHAGWTNHHNVPEKGLCHLCASDLLAIKICIDWLKKVFGCKYLLFSTGCKIYIINDPGMLLDVCLMLSVMWLVYSIFYYEW